MTSTTKDQPAGGASENTAPIELDMLAKQLDMLAHRVEVLEEAARTLLLSNDRMERLIAGAVARQMAVAQMPQLQRELEQTVLERLRSGEVDQ